SALRTEVRSALNEGFQSRSVDELVRWLAHPDMRLRQRAQFELVRRKQFALLRETALSPMSDRLARVHALWGLEQGRAVRSSDDLPLSDSAPQIRAQSVRVAGDLRLRDATRPLIKALGDPDPPVCFQAALALGKIGDPTAFDGLTGLLATNADADPFLRHAAVMGLAGVAQPSALASLKSHVNAAVRLGAVVALRRIGSAAVAEFLSDPDTGVRREAVRAIHDERSIPE